MLTGVSCPSQVSLLDIVVLEVTTEQKERTEERLNLNTLQAANLSTVEHEVEILAQLRRN